MAIPIDPDALPLVGVVMGSESDWSTMCEAANVLTDFGVPFEARVLSAHRTPDRMTDYARAARERGIQVIVAGAGGAAHLPGMIAASTTLPVIGVPIPTTHLQGLDSLLSIVQMPGGVPVATVAIGQAKNAALLAIEILSIHDSALAEALASFRVDQVERVDGMDARVSDEARG